MPEGWPAAARQPLRSAERALSRMTRAHATQSAVCHFGSTVKSGRGHGAFWKLLGVIGFDSAQQGPAVLSVTRAMVLRLVRCMHSVCMPASVSSANGNHITCKMFTHVFCWKPGTTLLDDGAIGLEKALALGQSPSVAPLNVTHAKLARPRMPVTQPHPSSSITPPSPHPSPGSSLAGAAGAQCLQDAAAAGHRVRPLVLAQLRLAVGLG
jgi:hypothetical protein